MREIVKTPNIEYIERDDLLLHDTKYNQDISLYQKESTNNSLLVYPAQCNFNGYKYPLNAIKNIQKTGLDVDKQQRSNWFICLDAASFVSTNDLNLQNYKPDYVCISFYKIFGQVYLIFNYIVHCVISEFTGTLLD